MPYDVIEAPDTPAEMARSVPSPTRSKAAAGVTPGAARSVPAPVRVRAAAAGGTSVTTYYYRTSVGVFGSTTSLGSIPSGASLLNRVTT